MPHFNGKTKQTPLSVDVMRRNVSLDGFASARLSVINQIEGPIITLRDDRNQENIDANLYQNSDFPGQVV